MVEFEFERVTSELTLGEFSQVQKVLTFPTRVESKGAHDTEFLKAYRYQHGDDELEKYLKNHSIITTIAGIDYIYQFLQERDLIKPQKELKAWSKKKHL